MVSFWIVIAVVILLAATVPSYINTSVGSICSNNLLHEAVVSDENTETEYAIVMATITDKQVADGNLYTYEHVMHYHIDEIRYMPSARSEIQVMDGTFMAGSRAFSSVDIGGQFVVPFLKHGHLDAGWAMSPTYCSGLYHTDALEYIEWFGELRDSQSHDGGDDLYPYELGHFRLPPDRLPYPEPPEKIGYQDKISIARLSNVTSIEEDLASGYLVLKNMYVFDTVYNFYNADPRTEIELSAWGIGVLKNLEEGHLYFLYRSAMPYGGIRVTAMEPLESSYDLIRNTSSTENIRQIAFYNDARYFHSVLYSEIWQNSALDGKIYARYNEQYDPDMQDTHKHDRYEYEMYVKIYQMDQKVLDEWKALLKKYGLEDAKTSYRIVLPVSVFPEPPYETWRDYQIPTVKDQMDWKTPPFEILCEGTLHLVILPDGMPACVTASETLEMFADGSAIMQVRPTVILNVDG